MMSNDLVELNLVSCEGSITDDVIETIFTTRVNPGDETSPLKFGKLQRLYCRDSSIGARGVHTIVQNLPHLTHLYLPNSKDFDVAMAALIGDEHVDPLHPYPALPNLVCLSLYGSSITNPGYIELSKSQLLDQLEYLNLFSHPHPGPIQIGETALLTTPLYSNMRTFRSPADVDYHRNFPQSTHQHLSNANNDISSYIDLREIDQFWDDE